MSYSVIEDGHISSPAGFRATGVSSGLKEIRARDLAIVYSQHPCRVAALFTSNALRAAPIFFNQAILARNREGVRAVLINSGYANAGTGQSGLTNAVECAKIAADELEVPRDSIMLMSNGQIGVALPMEKMRDGIRRAASELDSGAGHRAAIAILTTDTRPKDRAFRVQVREGRSIIVAGMAKGNRMPHPRMGSLMAILTTDAPIDSRLLARSLDQSYGKSFGRMMIDSDTSPNDGVILMANGAEGGNPIVDASSWEFAAWQESLDAICTDLAMQVVRDAASGGKFVQIHVRGATNETTARQVAQTVARSASVRWACAKGVAEWGGILVAVGASGVELRPETIELRIGATTVFLDGIPARFDPISVIQTISAPEIEVTIDLHMGPGNATIWTCTSPGDVQ